MFLSKLLGGYKLSTQRAICGDRCRHGEVCAYSGFKLTPYELCNFYESPIYEQIRKNNAKLGNPVWKGGWRK